jgi:hypothetical protein
MRESSLVGELMELCVMAAMPDAVYGQPQGGSIFRLTLIAYFAIMTLSL